MKIARESVLDRLPASQPCLGAVFTSFAFDPRMFEEQVLRAVLDMRTDPAELPARFLDEGRARVQATPVAVIVDAGQRQAGRRLPYDLLEVDGEVFHPKGTLLLYEDHARLQVGSGNLTRGGYGGNAELFVVLELRYSEPADAELLRSFDQFLQRCGAQARHAGTQLAAVRAELDRRLQPTQAQATRREFALLDGTLARPLLDQIFDLLPNGAKVERVGMLAPFFESDSGSAGGSLFTRLVELAGADIELDVGMAWDNPSPICETPELPALAERLGQLWCWRFDSQPAEVEYIIPTRILRKNFEYIDQWGDTQRWSLADAERARADKRLWPVDSPAAFAPARALGRVAKQVRRLGTWLFPASRLRDDRPDHQPLHAKLIVITFEHQGASRTLVVVGSANLSRAALLRGSERGGNVEVCVAFCLNGSLRLHDLAPELVRVPLELLRLSEREFPELGTNYGLCIERAIHDPAAATLEVVWDRRRSASVGLPGWQLRYADELLGEGEGAPADDLCISPFHLRPDSAELTLQVGDREFAVPIFVSDLAKLPVRQAELDMDLQLLLHVLAGRIGRERAASLQARARQLGRGEGAGLEAIFGEGFGPVDVFRAWWGACADLRDPSLPLQAFRVAIVGSMGLELVWEKILAATQTTPPGLSQAQAWFYGAELLRELGKVRLSDEPAGRAKAEVLSPFVARLRSELAELIPRMSEEAWMRHVIEFYGVRP